MPPEPVQKTRPKVSTFIPSGTPGSAEAKQLLQAEHASHPFTATALMTAVEMLEGHPLLDVTERTSVPLLAIINAMDEDAITGEIEARLEDGYSTLKVKVGFDA